MQILEAQEEIEIVEYLLKDEDLDDVVGYFYD